MADRLTAFLLGAGDLAEAAAGVRLRRRDPQPVSGREESVQRISMLLAARTRLPLVVCGPDSGAILAAAAGTPLGSHRASGSSSARRRSPTPDSPPRSAQGLLCVDGLENLSPTERAQLLRTLDESPERIVLLAGAAQRRDRAQ